MAKSYTDLEQSRKLAEILPIESADMSWTNNKLKKEVSANLSSIVEMQAYFDRSIYDWDRFYELTPCWSLSALLDIFPCSKESPLVNLTRGGWIPSFTRRWFATWEDENKNIFYSGDGITSVDAVVELILKLHEQNIL